MRKLKKSKRGSAAVEFALIAPVLFFLIFGIMEVSFIMLAQGIVEFAVRESSRAGITGYTPAGLTRDQYVKQVIDQNLVFLDPAKVTMQTLIYPSYQNIGQPEPYTDQNGNNTYNIGEPFTDINGNGQWDLDMGKSGSGAAGDIVVYRVTYSWTMLTPLIGKYFTSNGQFNIKSSMVVRNEPF